MKKVFPAASSGTNILAQNPLVEGRDNRDASRISQNSPGKGTENCPRCGSDSFFRGAGLKPGQMSLRCSECKVFIGYTNLEKLQRLRRRKSLSTCLELLEKSGVSGDAAVFVLGQIGGEV
jgi:transposase-like protein